MSKIFSKNLHTNANQLADLNRFSQEFKFKKIEYVIRLYTILGLCMAVFGLAYFLMSTFNINLSEEQIKGIALFLSGILTVFFCRIILVLRRLKLSRDLMLQQMELSLHSVIDIWQNFEDVGQSLLKDDKINIDADYLSIENIVSGLKSRDLISNSDIDIIKEYIKARNKVAHGDISIDNSELIYQSQKMSEIISKLQKTLESISKY